MPPRMMGLRPIRSESPPRITKNGVASSSAMPTMILEVTTSSFWTVCRKNSAQNWLLPDHALPDHHHGRDEHVLDVLTEERLAPGVDRGLALGFHLGKDRCFLQLQPDVERDHNQDQREHKRDSPAPCAKGLVAQRQARADDDNQGEHETDRRRGLQISGVVSAATIGGVL